MIINAKEENKFTAVCEAHKFERVKVDRDMPNAYAPQSKYRADIIHFSRTSEDGRTHIVRVTLSNQGDKSWILWFKQTNGIEAPCHGDNSRQLDRALAGESF
jgi:hypothetical protein